MSYIAKMGGAMRDSSGNISFSCLLAIHESKQKNRNVKIKLAVAYHFEVTTTVPCFSKL